MVSLSFVMIALFFREHNLVHKNRHIPRKTILLFTWSDCKETWFLHWWFVKRIARNLFPRKTQQNQSNIFRKHNLLLKCLSVILNTATFPTLFQPVNPVDFLCTIWNAVYEIPLNRHWLKAAFLLYPFPCSRIIHIWL